jgi:hypothetical protein
MSDIGYRKDEIELLIDRHAELCEFFDGKNTPLGREVPPLMAPNGGRTTSECLADLVDQALAAYGSADFAQDPRIFALKIALTDAILELA